MLWVLTIEQSLYRVKLVGYINSKFKKNFYVQDP